MAFDPQHGHAALRRGRWSSPGAEYFLTFCTEQRAAGLDRPDLTAAIWDEIAAMESKSLWRWRCGVVMPDHLHLLITLVADAALPEVVRLCKGRLAPVLRRSGLSWQRAYFDHRLRPDEDRLPVFLYVFMNPYRAGFLDVGSIWPGYRCTAEDWAWFEPLTSDSRPMPEWLA